MEVSIPEFEVKPATEYFLHLEASTREATDLLPSGHIVASEQMPWPVDYIDPEVTKMKGVLKLEQTDRQIKINGEGFEIVFSTDRGELISLAYQGNQVLKEALRPNFWRAQTDNDVANGMMQRCGIWLKAGEELKLEDLKVGLSLIHI